MSKNDKVLVSMAKEGAVISKPWKMVGGPYTAIRKGDDKSKGFLALKDAFEYVNPTKNVITVGFSSEEKAQLHGMITAEKKP